MSNVVAIHTKHRYRQRLQERLQSIAQGQHLTNEGCAHLARAMLAVPEQYKLLTQHQKQVMQDIYNRERWRFQCN